MSEQAAQSVVEIAEKYYDSTDADSFYFNIWGGEDIHIGLYESPFHPVRDASHLTVERMADQLREVGPKTRILDVGAGYGGAGRYLAGRFGCHVSCLNLSEIQNQRNREMTQAAGLSSLVDVVYGNFEQLPFEANAFDVVWSQDAILHSGDRPRVLDEIARVLRPGGQLIFTDPMQADDCPQDVLGPVLARIHLETLGSFAFYRAELSKRGFSEIKVIELTDQLGRHYARVREELSGRYDEMIRLASKDYVDRMLQGLNAWTDAESQGYLAWGILHFSGPSRAELSSGTAR
jgi:sarcosine/dimethylglycine N-methyltransferase